MMNLYVYVSKKNFKKCLDEKVINKENIINILKHCLSGIKKDKKLMLKAMETNPNCYSILPQKIREDKEILAKFMGKNEYLANLAPKKLQQELKDEISDKGTGIDDLARAIYHIYDKKQLEVIFYDLAKNGSNYSVTELFNDIRQLAYLVLDFLDQKREADNFKSEAEKCKERVKTIKTIADAQSKKVEKEREEEAKIEIKAKKAEDKKAKKEADKKAKKEADKQAKKIKKQSELLAKAQLIEDIRSEFSEAFVSRPRTAEEIELDRTKAEEERIRLEKEIRQAKKAKIEAKKAEKARKEAEEARKEKPEKDQPKQEADEQQERAKVRREKPDRNNTGGTHKIDIDKILSDIGIDIN